MCVQIWRDSASKDPDIPQLVSAMKLSSGVCVKFVQITYLTSIKCSCLSSEISAQSAKNTIQGEMYQMSRYKRFQLSIRKF